MACVVCEGVGIAWNPVTRRLTGAINCPTWNASVVIVLEKEVGLYWEPVETRRLPGGATTCEFGYSWAVKDERYRTSLRRQCIACDYSDPITSGPLTIP